MKDGTIKDATSLIEGFDLDDEGLHYYFGPYAVACYACGTYQVTIPYADLLPYARPDSALTRAAGIE